MEEKIYIASLLHDIGEFLKITNNDLSHEELSALIVDRLSFIEQEDKSIIKELILNHHFPKTDLEKIVAYGDVLSCEEGRYKEDDNKDIPYLKSIFQNIKPSVNKINQEYIYDINVLSYKNIFPINQENIELDRDKLINYIEDFYREIEMVKDEDELLFVLEKYLWCVPVNDIGGNFDVSLYEHLKNAAAISLCLYKEYEKGSLDIVENIQDSEYKQFILLNGDISGIQKFILRVPSYGAAKSLKGNSIYLNVLSQVIVNYILDELNLKRANLLYNGGGSFFILGPEHYKEKLDKLIKKINKKILKAHNLDIFYALDYLEISPQDFVNFSLQWQRIVDKVNLHKTRKWLQLDEDTFYEEIFNPLDSGVKEGEHCHVCGQVNIMEESENGKNICSLCLSYIEFTKDIRFSKYMTFKDYREEVENISTYKDIFRLFGQDVVFGKKPFEEGKNLLINSFDFIEEGGNGYISGAFRLPVEEDEVLTFDDIALKARSENNLLGVLKLDVDNLGTIFGFGLEDNRTISRITSLSRMISLFFEGYITELENDERFKNKIYIVYSGGDDTFLIGAWDAVIEFAKEFRKQFSKYTCFNEVITFSAGIGIFMKNYPITKSIEVTENYLSSVKDYIYEGEKTNTKNKVALMGEIFNWAEIEEIEEMISILSQSIKLMNESRKNLSGKAILTKITKSTSGFKNILKKSTEGKLDSIKFWKLAYYLSDLKNINKEGEKLAFKIIDKYKEIVLKNLLQDNSDDYIRNIMIIPVAVRITEFLHKDGGKNGDI